MSFLPHQKLPTILFGLFILFSSSLIILPASAEQTIVVGSTLYTYTSDPAVCPTSVTHRNTHGIIVPKGTTQVKNAYFYFHGWGNPEPTATCAKLCGIVSTLQNSAIFLHSGIKGESGNKTLTTAEMNCYKNEAIEKLKSFGITVDISNNILVAHSAGGTEVMAWLQNGFTANKNLLFDGCYGDWCTKIANKGIQTILYYSNDPKDTTKTESLAAKTARPGNVKTIDAKTGHETVPNACFLDHILNNACGQKDGSEETVICKDSTCLSSLEQDIKLSKPKTAIQIPKLNFSNIVETINAQGERFFYIPWIGEYIAAIYKFAMVVASILAVIVIILSGARMIISAGGEEKNAATKRLGQALVGLFLCWGSYAILYNINPDLVEFKALKIYVVREDLLGEDFETEAQSRTTPSADNLGGAPGGIFQTENKTDSKKKAGDLSYVFCDESIKSQKFDDMESYMATKQIKVDYTFFGTLDCNKNKNTRAPTKFTLHHGSRQKPAQVGSASVRNMVFDWRYRSMTIDATAKLPMRISSHYAIDRQGVIYPLVDPRFTAWHSPSQNGKGIGIDLLYDTSGALSEIFFTPEQYKSVAALLEFLRTKFTGIGTSDSSVVGHGECEWNRNDASNFDFQNTLKNYLPANYSFDNSKHNRIYVSSKTKSPSDTKAFSTFCGSVCKKGEGCFKQ